MDKEREINGLTAWPFERKCKVCGKMFAGTVMDEWIYRVNGIPVCSWGCQRKTEIEREEKAQAAREASLTKKLKPGQKEILIRGLIVNGMTTQEISKRTGMSPQLVNYYRRKIEEAWTDGEETDHGKGNRE